MWKLPAGILVRGNWRLAWGMLQDIRNLSRPKAQAKL